MQLAGAVECLHDAGFIHRDLKPWNIILADDLCSVKVIDFGLATPLKPSERHLPFAALLSGTRQYMAPEIAIGDGHQAYSEDDADLREIDLSKVDVFALGVTLVNMLTGDYIFVSCYSEEYERIYADDSFLGAWLSSKLPRQDKEEQEDLVQLIKGMLHPEVEKRLAIRDLKSQPWLLRFQSDKTAQ